MDEDKRHQDIVGDRGSRRWGRFPPVLLIGAAIIAIWLVAMALGAF